MKKNVLVTALAMLQPDKKETIEQVTVALPDAEFCDVDVFNHNLFKNFTVMVSINISPGGRFLATEMYGAIKEALGKSLEKYNSRRGLEYNYFLGGIATYAVIELGS